MLHCGIHKDLSYGLDVHLDGAFTGSLKVSFCFVVLFQFGLKSKSPILKSHEVIRPIRRQICVAWPRRYPSARPELGSHPRPDAPPLLFQWKFAVVRKCVERTSGHEYAAKFMKKRRKGQDCRSEVIHEIAVLELATASRRVVDLHQVYETASEMVLVLEL